MDQEKETKRQAERCRALAQRIVRELTPASIQVLGGSGALAEALEKAGAQLLPENAEQGTAALLVVEDPEWVDLPALQCAQVLLVCTDASAMADCAKQLAAQGLYRDFEWKNRGKAQQTALFCQQLLCILCKLFIFLFCYGYKLPQLLPVQRCSISLFSFDLHTENCQIIIWSGGIKQLLGKCPSVGSLI